MIEEEKKGEEVDDEMAFLDKAIAETQEEYKQMGVLQGINHSNSVLAMTRANFNFKREMKSLFAKAIGGNQQQSLEEEKKEVRQ